MHTSNYHLDYACIQTHTQTQKVLLVLTWLAPVLHALSLEKSQEGCGRWAPQLKLTPPCSSLVCDGLI